MDNRTRQSADEAFAVGGEEPPGSDIRDYRSHVLRPELTENGMLPDAGQPTTARASAAAANVVSISDSS